MARRRLVAAALTLVAGCHRTPVEVAATPPPPVAVTLAPMPAGGRPGMTIPPRRADGSYATPNAALSADAAVWHLRTGLNVAALACRGAQEATIVAQYNALIAARVALLRRAQDALSKEYKAGGGDWQDRYDDSMTRLYNYWSQDFARPGFCAAAAETLAAAAAESDATFPAFAQGRLAMLDRPFTAFFAAYDAWRRQAQAQVIHAPAAG